MELCKEYQSLCINEAKERIKDNFELDFQENLPQYLDDIEKIIKCSVNSAITDYDCRNSSITIYGKSIISITYKSSNSCILSNIFEEEFSRSFDFNSVEGFCFAKIALKSKYNNIHLINQRRIDIHTALSVCIDVFCNNTVETLSSCENAFFKEYSTEYLSCKASAITSADFDESINVIDNDSQIKNIINCSPSCRIDENKIIKDKMLIKGTVSVCFVYECINGEVEKTATSFIFSKIVEAQNLEETDAAFINASISNTYVKAKADDNNCLRIIEFIGKISIDYQIYSTQSINFSVDTYVPHCLTNSKSAMLNIKANPVYFLDNKSIEQTFDCDENLVEIIDLKAEIRGAFIEKSTLKFNICLCAIYYDNNSNICCIEKEQEAQIVLSDSKQSGICSALIQSYDFVIKGGGAISLRTNIEYMAYLFDDKSINYITDIEVLDDNSPSNHPQLTLYFADKNEEVWEIAKKFSTSSSLIIDGNSLNSNVIDAKRILLIPGM